jgi:hypothetical protein
METLTDIKLSEPPISHFKQLAEKSVTGNLLSSTFGGGTADVEFEMLTGFLNRFAETEPTAYESLLDGPTMSAASVFKRFLDNAPRSNKILVPILTTRRRLLRRSARVKNIFSPVTILPLTN